MARFPRKRSALSPSRRSPGCAALNQNWQSMSAVARTSTANEDDRRVAELVAELRAQVAAKAPTGWWLIDVYSGQVRAAGLIGQCPFGDCPDGMEKPERLNYEPHRAHALEYLKDVRAEILAVEKQSEELRAAGAALDALSARNEEQAAAVRAARDALGRFVLPKQQLLRLPRAQSGPSIDWCAVHFMAHAEILKHWGFIDEKLIADAWYPGDTGDPLNKVSKLRRLLYQVVVRMRMNGSFEQFI